MSSELQAFFPSTTHPAFPVATQVLSTLRNSTGPGKGNDLRPEERAALVGISALIGCEKVQSRDLVEKTVQKASSVSPAHFRSALKRARDILASLPSDAASPSSSRRQPVRGGSDSPHKPTMEISSANPLEAISPFSTPKKKFKYSSGIDISGLVKHSPSKGSPLKQSTTPLTAKDAGPRGAASARAAHGVAEEEEGAELEEHVEETEEDMVQTPSKSRHLDKDIVMPGTGDSRRRRKEDMSAFLALRPGSGSDGAGIGDALAKRSRAVSPDEEEMGRSAREIRSLDESEKRARRIRRRIDWTFREDVWASDARASDNEHALLRLLGKDLALQSISVS